ncbi:MAG: hypothetical protein U0931_27005 [Vulcanimicrobiota bacterium]
MRNTIWPGFLFISLAVGQPVAAVPKNYPQGHFRADFDGKVAFQHSNWIYRFKDVTQVVGYYPGHYSRQRLNEIVEGRGIDFAKITREYQWRKATVVEMTGIEPLSGLPIDMRLIAAPTHTYIVMARTPEPQKNLRFLNSFEFLP